MVAPTAPTLEVALRPQGLPWGMAAGNVINVRFFIPAKEFKYRQGFELEVPAWERAGVTIRYSANKKPYVHHYKPEKTEQWEEHVGENAIAELRAIPADIAFTLPFPDTSRVLAHMRFNLRKPASYSRWVIWPTKKPDVDNLSKAILDGLVQGAVLADDNNVTDLTLQKRYADGEHPPGVEVELIVMLNVNQPPA